MPDGIREAPDVTTAPPKWASRFRPIWSRYTPWLISIFLASAWNGALAQGDYQLGHGYNIGPFNFAGFSDVTATATDDGRKAFSLDDLSLFISGHVSPAFNPFLEAELTRLDFLRGGGSRSGDNGSLVVERLYDDIDLGDAFRFRVGKMLAPVGEWNEIHAAPLVLSVTRPAATVQNLSEYLTGISLIYNNPYGDLPDIQLYWQPHGEFSERPSSIAFDTYKIVEGIHIKFPLSLLDQIGFSFQRATNLTATTQSLIGVDFQLTFGKLTLQGEGTFSDLGGQTQGFLRKQEWAGYLAASYAITNKWSIYTWYEEFLGRSNAGAARDLLWGAAFRPDPAIVFKLEYLHNIGGRPVNPTGIFASWSVLF